MPRKRQSKDTPERRKPSTLSDDGETAALDDCLDRLRQLNVDARNFHFELTHLSRGREAQILWAKYPATKTQWLRDAGDAIKAYIARLHDCRSDAAWIRSEVEKNWSRLERERQGLTGIICEILTHAGTVGSANLEAESATKAAEVEHSLLFTAAKQAALEPIKLPVKKQDLSRYFEAAQLTEKQFQVASLKWEYGLAVPEIARQIGKHRKTVEERLSAAQRKMDYARANERHAKHKAPRTSQDTI